MLTAFLMIYHMYFCVLLSQLRSGVRSKQPVIGIAVHSYHGVYIDGLPVGLPQVPHDQRQGAVQSGTVCCRWPWILTQ